MHKENIFNILFIIISRTPFWVWILLIFLIKRGISTSQERKVNIPKSFIAPIIFTAWGLDTMVDKFSYVRLDLVVYILLAIFGIFIGFNLYKKYQGYLLKEDGIYHAKCYLPLIIIIVNFMLKYILNVAIGANPHFSLSLGFNMIYSIISGTSVGLFLGGILNTFIQIRKIYRMEK
ncbi:MAG: DUF1453 domain-containing protein [Clostridium baratii]|uniref:Putative membrane protein n=1 Tax=Clostridium baratii str. Sullivan TaxID=1415775 RepID=A0A0A7FWU6_9CLOT|nr:DUF6622 family protein [Clostridium baratii]AIY83385.1 putative membrane protein [Clostridium baratii str. Sullivan]MBS6008177.1 DUF1453 domain-containing protein [Clostridium baratii]MDU1055420.1 DUF6622 family protein [Clostridium baratii]MDU4911997.1 DUF6622 family protein [Clostridium baratii]CUP64693.1 Uncharacterised protein [Clostridium baratii]